MAISFDVADVVPGSYRVPRCSVSEAIRYLTATKPKIEAISKLPDGVGRLESARRGGLPLHPFVATIHTAYDHHLALKLSPDQVWLVIAQGFASHVKLHAEALRHQFVSHEGKVQLVMIRDDLVLGGENDWPGVFEGFAQQLATHIGKRHDLVVADFSTTGAIERMLSQLVLMDAMQSCFNFMLVSLCGIPRITLTGTPADWRSVRARTQCLREFGLDWWLDSLTPILDAFVDAAEGRVDSEFWASICKVQGFSGGPYYSGWMHVLFPYLTNRRGEFVPNKYLTSWREGMNLLSNSGPAAHEFPPALSSAPMVWEYLSRQLPMTLLGGFVGIEQDRSTREVTPALGWAILHDLPQ